MGRGARAETVHQRSRTIRFQTPKGSFEGVLNESPIAQALSAALPMASTVNRWGEEIYFDVPVTAANAAPTTDVQVGDLAYWPEGPCLCIFFGKTPASRGSEPRPASAVTIVGRTEAPAALLHSITDGMAIRVETARTPSPQPTSRDPRSAAR